MIDLLYRYIIGLSIIVLTSFTLIKKKDNKIIRGEEEEEEEEEGGISDDINLAMIYNFQTHSGVCRTLLGTRL